MELSNEQIRRYIKRLMLSRLRILCNNGFYGLLLMHMTFSMDEKCETAYTDGTRIAFGPSFLEELKDSELDFVMMHEILHVVLQHCFRAGQRDSERFNIACDIVVNSNILLSNNMKLSSISIKNEGPGIHIAPDGKEGYEYTAEQVYEMLPSSNKKKKNSSNSDSTMQAKAGSEQDKDNATPGKHSRSEHSQQGTNVGKSGSSASANVSETPGPRIWDDHSRWGMYEEDATLRDVWVKRFEDACEAVSIRDPSNSRGLIPAFAERLFKELRKSQTDWRTILNDFIQEEVVDYSFTPPDRRFDDSPFFLPDFNGKEDMVEDILFMIDTSGSMSDDMITAAYSEVKGAIDQFDGKLKGWLGFFDAAIIQPRPFESEEEFRIIKPAGGGGTDFQIIFEYVIKDMQDKLPASIIILTDGYAPFPQEQLARGIPVLWLLNNEEITPPWGKIARITV